MRRHAGRRLRPRQQLAPRSREVDLAVEKGKPLLPVRVADIAPTGSLDYLLRLAQWIDLFPGTIDDHATNLQTTVASVLGQRDPKPPPTPPDRHRRRPPITRRALTIAASIAAVIALVGTAIALSRDDSGTEVATGEPTNETGADRGLDLGEQRRSPRSVDRDAAAP